MKEEDSIQLYTVRYTHVQKGLLQQEPLEDYTPTVTVSLSHIATSCNEGEVKVYIKCEGLV